MKTFTAFLLIMLFFVSGAHVFILFTSPYYLDLGEYLQLIFVSGVMLFSIIGIIAVVEPYKYVDHIVAYTSLIVFLLLIISSEFLIELSYKLF